MLITILLVVHLLLGVAMIGVILLQRGQGATAGAAFGSGASSTVFGARGSASLLTRVTSILAMLFIANSLALARIYGNVANEGSLMDRVQTTLDSSAPSLPPVPAPTADPLSSGAIPEEQQDLVEAVQAIIDEASDTGTVGEAPAATTPEEQAAAGGTQEAP
ncbi:MAG: preprotein translocase subunit SecG [Gammaproteobacteria bacterium]|nr:preprotein translocase subunit SecG [Gammaproteobacteria bacterium]